MRFGIEGLGFRVSGFGFVVSGLGFGFWLLAFGFWVLSLEFGVLGFGFGVWGSACRTLPAGLSCEMFVDNPPDFAFRGLRFSIYALGVDSLRLRFRGLRSRV